MLLINKLKAYNYLTAHTVRRIMKKKFTKFLLLVSQNERQQILTIACVLYECGNHHIVRYKFKNCKPVATSVNTKFILSKSRSPSWGIYGNGMCFGGAGLSENFTSGVEDFVGDSLDLARFPLFTSSSIRGVVAPCKWDVRMFCYTTYLI